MHVAGGLAVSDVSHDPAAPQRTFATGRSWPKAVATLTAHHPASYAWRQLRISSLRLRPSIQQQRRFCGEARPHAALDWGTPIKSVRQKRVFKLRVSNI
jgi:hypothetical protein